MPNVLKVTAENPTELLNAGAYDTGAVIRLQWSATELGAYADVSGTGSTPTIPLVAEVRSYTGYDPNGTSTTWYRTRYQNAAATRFSDWSDPFQVAAEEALVVSLYDLKMRLGLPASTVNDGILSQICAETSRWVESYCGRYLRPVASATYTFDGGGSETHDDRTLDLFRYGVRAVTLLETANQTGGSFSTVPSTDYFLRPTPTDLEPATKIVLNNTGSYRFYSGYGVVRVTMTAGFEKVPDDVRAVAIGIATRAWHGRQSGMQDIVGSVETGEAVVTTIVAPEFKRALDHYRPVLVR